VTDFLDDKRKEINDRLAVLKPAVAEYERLEAAASALAKLGGPTPVAATPTAATVAAPRRKKRPGRPRGAGRRKKVVKAAAVATAAAPEAATPTAVRKGPGRPKGSGRKVGRPAGTGKKVGRPAGSGKKVGRPAGKKVGRPKGRVGRRKGSGTRAAQALSFVQGQPGITIPELAAKMAIKQNYLYRVLPGLEQEGKLEKKGRGWHPKGG
jgi:hypothetical protein